MANSYWQQWMHLRNLDLDCTLSRGAAKQHLAQPGVACCSSACTQNDDRLLALWLHQRYCHMGLYVLSHRHNVMHVTDWE